MMESLLSGMGWNGDCWGGLWSRCGELERGVDWIFLGDVAAWCNRIVVRFSLAPLDRSKWTPCSIRYCKQKKLPRFNPAFVPIKSPSASSSHFPLPSPPLPPPHHHHHHHPASSSSSPPSSPPHPAQNSKHQTQTPETPNTFP